MKETDKRFIRLLGYVVIDNYLHAVSRSVTNTLHVIFGVFMVRKKLKQVQTNRDSLRASQQAILSKHRNPNSFQEFCLFYFPKNTNKFGFLENKKPTTIIVGFLLRRKRDSNPRTCYSQQFSRLPHSTTLPFLRSCFTIKYSGCKYRKGFHFVKAFLLFLIE